MSEIYRKLRELEKSDMVPLHMPGHKRNKAAGDMSGYFDIDITEIDNFDNLHEAEGIILEAEERANLIYGADETHFLVNGSTCGVLAAVSACVPKGGKIIVARNCHKSFYHAAYLRELEMVFINPEKMDVRPGKRDAEAIKSENVWKAENNYSEKITGNSVLYGKINLQELELKCSKNTEAKAVFITSPTYEGIPSDIKKIAEIVHSHGMVLIVDEAHGAHFGLSDRFPENSVTLGADVVIHSVHKTLASMTQTALIHIKGERVNRELLRRFLRIYQSSSPSYVLMSSIDSCMKDISERGANIFERVWNFRKKIERELSECKYIFVPDTSIAEDPCKVLICSKTKAITGQYIYDILRIEHHIQPEMAGDFYALAIITGYDTEDNINRFIKAVIGLDRAIEINFSEETNYKKISNRKKNPGDERNLVSLKERKIDGDLNIEEVKKAIPFYKAWDAETDFVKIEDATGKISGDFVNLYPPGIPLIIPGEVFSKDQIEKIEYYIRTGRNVQGYRKNDDGNIQLRIIKKSK